MRNHLCIIALYLLAVVSCTPDLGVGTPFVEGQEVTLTASIADNPSGAKQMPGKQRVSGKDAGVTINLTWNAGDEILVSVGDKSAVFTLSSGETTSAGEFTGKMPADGSEYSVSYPVDYSDDVLTYQTYVENGFGNGLMKMSTKKAGTLNNGFTLSADNALLGLQLSGNVIISKIVLTNLATNATYTLDCSKQEVSTTGGKLFYIVVPTGTWDKGMKVDVYNAEEIIIESKEKTSSIEFAANIAMMMPELEMHDCVDLGLSVKWATCNVGAETPEDYGDYFAWGETEPKEEYTWENYKWCDGTSTNMTKYNAADGKTELDSEDDATHVHWGNKWRTPTLEECQELVESCTWTWTTKNGINGHLITGINGNSIFLPATGAFLTSGLAHAGYSGYYWINSISTTSPRNKANDIYNRPPNSEMNPSLPPYGTNAYYRYVGRPIRPVHDDNL